MAVYIDPTRVIIDSNKVQIDPSKVQIDPKRVVVDQQPLTTQDKLDAIRQAPNPIADTWASGLSGLTLPLRAGANIAAQVSPNELTQGIADLAAKTEYQPQTMQGQFGKFAGELAPMLALPAVSLPQRLGSLGKIVGGAATGAYQSGLYGGMESAQRGDDLQEVLEAALIFGGIGGVAGGAIPAIGKGYEAVAPLMGRMANIPSSSTRRALEAIEEGGTIFGKRKEDVERMVRESLESMEGKQLPKSDINKIVNDVITKYRQGAPFSAEELAVKSPLRELRKLIDDAVGGVDTSKLDVSDLDTLRRIKQANPGITESEILTMLDVDTRIADTVDPTALHQIKRYLQNIVDFEKEAPRYGKQGASMLRELQRSFGDKLKQEFPEYAPAMREYADYMASQDFNRIFRQESPFGISRAISMPLAFGGAPFTGGSTAGLYGLMEAASSPALQRQILNLYGIGTQVSPYAVRTGMVGTGQFRE